jgi:hypothetical protein
MPPLRRPPVVAHTRQNTKIQIADITGVSRRLLNSEARGMKEDGTQLLSKAWMFAAQTDNSGITTTVLPAIAEQSAQ